MGNQREVAGGWGKPWKKGEVNYKQIEIIWTPLISLWAISHLCLMPESTSYPHNLWCHFCWAGPFQTPKGLRSHIHQKHTCHEAQNRIVAAACSLNNFPGTNGVQPQYILPTSHVGHTSPDPGLGEIETEYRPPTYGQEDYYSPNLEVSQQSSEREYVIEQVEGAARIINKPINGYLTPQNWWETLQAQENPEYPYFPWCSFAESKLVDWLASSGLYQAKIDDFLQLEWVRYLHYVILLKSQ